MCDVFYSLRHLAAKRFPSKCSFKKVIINLEMIFTLKCLFSAVILWALLKFLFFPKSSEFVTLPIKCFGFGSDCML